MRFILLAALLLGLGLEASYSGNTISCAASGWPVPEPPSGSKLLQVNVVSRHGDRVPVGGQPCWPDDAAVWNCYLNSAEIPLYSDTQYGPIIPRVYRKVFRYGGEPLNGNCSLGQLTVTGFKQLAANGDSLRKAYVDTGFLDPQFNLSEVYIRSDDVPRTQKSAEALILSMFPPNGSSTKIVELHTQDLTYDDINPNPTLCPKLAEYTEEFKNSSVWKDHQNITKSVLNEISEALNYTVGEADLQHLVDCLTTHLCHNLPWPKGMTDKLYNISWEEFSWQFFTFFKYPSASANAQVGIGFLLKEIWQNMNSSLNGENPQKFLLYSGHDTTLIPILVALEIDTMTWPLYGSMMLLELYDISGKAYVRIIYNGVVLEMPFCAGKALCDFDTFSSYMHSITPTNPAVQCQVSSKKK